MDTDAVNHELLEKVIEIARHAGKLILEVYGSDDFEVTLKQDNSPLTRADKKAHTYIESALKELSAWPVLSEESDSISYEERRTWKKYWLVDPLDGTKEFIKRNGEFTVNIALIEESKAILGVVVAPVLGITYAAALGLGAAKSEDGTKWAPIHTANYENETLRIIASRSHAGEKLKIFLERVGKHEILSCGSSLKLCMVAEGKAHIYPRLGPTMEWDTAAAHCIVNEAGGRICTVADKELLYNKEDLLNPAFIVTGKPSFPWKDYLDY